MAGASAAASLAELGYEDRVLDVSGNLPRGFRLFRLPSENGHRTVGVERALKPERGRDNPFYLRVTLEDGTQAWTSPVYVLRTLNA